MFEECVCLLLRVNLFKLLIVENQEDIYDDAEDYYPYKEEEDDLDEVCFSSSTNLFIGNRSWGDNGYVRLGRQEVRPIYQPNFQDSSVGPSQKPKEAVESATGSRTISALKHEAADKDAK
ncbi:uncharacterized protein LOC121238207 [Juglans microcarpa x Juglans regia]|uniref:uncharacterized protein LOC121238207 n=1 Tax=Juglans microcarpa x Juglans regia TaxID=2249226 RepID=UPI001B7F5E24|nr:uncharacterized protein LOC121238207 [Juglans microcarpa x Juglans regia]